ncbi:YkyB family protein [Virgibacillus pantothenticus]|uniref:YkyB-like protein n=1 Tax=Virgibacillus pantothenticus TaxID=1473 RepID=A0A0L0QP79_VIRPA|nr:YkyB family protein [Virgibacillus pantothenticus]KNE20018.1 hypothetical protein AFK71_16615 [Virgibacillus pantothenticus]MED3737344.1 YkyB family protein [Virgibacillus pantothenticus]QTY18235.1 hypothetical protein KBP50_10585 [Virgibacillus pantothenticus]SIS59492.1 YkyB-like protein [Virgibacillus pantothenticus]
MKEQEQIEEIAKALYTVNRHAKTAPDPKHLYYIKKATINQLLQQNLAKKVGLHFSKHPKYSNQHSTLLVQVADYYFHIPPTKDDFKELQHLGELDDSYRNPQTKMSLSQAKKVIYRYINWKAKKPPYPMKRAGRRASTYYTPSSLGKMEWPPTKSHRN